MNPEKRRDISVQPFISLGEGTGFWEALSMGAETWWVGAGGQGRSS